MSTVPEITVVVPVYNSVQTLEPLYVGIKACLDTEQLSCEVLFVEDGGTDESWKELERLKAAYPDSIRLIRLARNYGQNAATVCGITHALGKAVITIDDDLQTPPAEISKLLASAKEFDSDIVFGVTSEQSNPFFKRVGSDLMKRIFTWADGAEIGSSFRYIGPSLKEQLAKQNHDQLFLNQVVHWYTERISKAVVLHESRAEGKSGYSIFGLIAMAMRLIFFYTDFPLRMMSVSGMLIALVCFGLGIFFIYERIIIGTEPGFASLITAIFFSTGIIMVCLSVLGGYISRIYADRIKKPVYAIKTIVQ